VTALCQQCLDLFEKICLNLLFAVPVLALNNALVPVVQMDRIARKQGAYSYLLDGQEGNV
jgi:hypothetical protein